VTAACSPIYSEVESGQCKSMRKSEDYPCASRQSKAINEGQAGYHPLHDDEEPGLLVRRALLESAGHRVLTALSGAEGVRIFRSEPVDAVIVDYWMAGQNGLAVARELKRLNRATPIIMLSAYTSLPDETIGLVDLWVQKGGESQNLLDSLERLLRKRASAAPAANHGSE